MDFFHWLAACLKRFDKLFKFIVVEEFLPEIIRLRVNF